MSIDISPADQLYETVVRDANVSTASGAEGYAFGIEAEFLLLDKQSNRPLFFNDLNFETLLNLIDAVPVQDLSHRGYDVKPLHRQAGPYLVEGYYLTDKNMKPRDLLAKGIELRTPIADSIDESVGSLEILYKRLQEKMSGAGYKTAIISHHPVACKFNAPPNYERHDYWQWALTAMTTMGPDFNISIPADMAEQLDLADFNDKVNYYMPSVVALSLASPLLQGDLWRVRGRIGKSIRTYRRSLWAPLYYIHNKNGRRFEFKGFEMSQFFDDYRAYFILCLALLLDQKLTGRASDQTRTYDMGQIAVEGLELSFVRERAAICLDSAEKVAARLGLDSSVLEELWQRLESRRTPADDIIDDFVRHGSVESVMNNLTCFYQNKAERAEKAKNLLQIKSNEAPAPAPPVMAELCLR